MEHGKQTLSAARKIYADGKTKLFGLLGLLSPEEVVALDLARTEDDFREDLEMWWELSYASWLTLPRVCMQAMPAEWQRRMARLLNEYRDEFPNQPDIGTRVQVTDLRGNLIKTPEWLINYRYPDREAIDKLKRQD